jgi:hypothetical protein
VKLNFIGGLTFNGNFVCIRWKMHCFPGAHQQCLL